MPSYSDRTEMKLYEDNPEAAVRFHIKGMRKLLIAVAAHDLYPGKMFGSPDNYNTKRMGQTPATRDLSKAPKREGTDIPDFTRAPVDPVKARRITLLYDTLFRILSRKEGSPFILNPVFGTEFIPTSTINVGLSTHIEESNRFEEYMKVHRPGAPRLLLMSKPVRQGEEWSSKGHIIEEILRVNGAIEEIAPLLKKNTRLEVIDVGIEDVIFISLRDPRGKGPSLGIMANLNLETDNLVLPPPGVKQYYLNAPPGGLKEIPLAPGVVTAFSY
jgi:hypothetical protein